MTTDLTDAARSDRYANAGGLSCPVCESFGCFEGDFDADLGGKGDMPQRCGDCKATWTEQWTLTGITDVKEYLYNWADRHRI